MRPAQESSALALYPTGFTVILWEYNRGMDIFFAIMGGIALVLLWDIYKQLRYLNDKVGDLLEVKEEGRTVNDIARDILG